MRDVCEGKPNSGAEMSVLRMRHVGCSQKTMLFLSLNLGAKVRHFFDTTKFFGKKMMSRGDFSPLGPELKPLRRLEIVNYWKE